jgi:hypothetical protein
MNRRAFIGGAALAAGGIAVSTVLPWTSAPVGAEQPTLATLSDWSIDDMWGVYPRYAERIDYPRARRPATAAAAAAGSIDALFYA